MYNKSFKNPAFPSICRLHGREAGEHKTKRPTGLPMDPKRICRRTGDGEAIGKNDYRVVVKQSVFLRGETGFNTIFFKRLSLF